MPNMHGGTARKGIASDVTIDCGTTGLTGLTAKVARGGSFGTISGSPVVSELGGGLYAISNLTAADWYDDGAGLVGISFALYDGATFKGSTTFRFVTDATRHYGGEIAYASPGVKVWAFIGHGEVDLSGGMSVKIMKAGSTSWSNPAAGATLASYAPDHTGWYYATLQAADLTTYGELSVRFGTSQELWGYGIYTVVPQKVAIATVTISTDGVYTYERIAPASGVGLSLGDAQTRVEVGRIETGSTSAAVALTAGYHSVKVGQAATSSGPAVSATNGFFNVQISQFVTEGDGPLVSITTGGAALSVDVAMAYSVAAGLIAISSSTVNYLTVRPGQMSCATLFAISGAAHVVTVEGGNTISLSPTTGQTIGTAAVNLVGHTYEGSLVVSDGTWRLSGGTVVKGDITASGTAVVEIGSDVVVQGNVTKSGSAVVKLGSAAVVTGTVSAGVTRMKGTANLLAINDVTLTGDGENTPWGPA